MQKRFTIVLLFALFAIFLSAQSSHQKQAFEVIAERGEVYFKFDLSDDIDIKTQIEDLSKIISIDNFNGQTITAYANLSEFTKFSAKGYAVEVLTPPSMLYKSVLENSRKNRDVTSFDYYPTYDEYVSMMYQFEADHPDLCEVVNIGSSTQGRELLFIHINNDLENDQNEPEFMYTSTMHGDELVGYILMLRLIDHLLVNYGIDPEITDMVDNIDIWINPNANPDGTYAGGNNTVWSSTRYNANNVDLNRNYADPEDGPHPDGNEYQAETVAFMDFADERNFVMSANIHSGAEVVNYPWDTWATLHADNDWWVLVSREYADTCHVYGPSGYFTDLNNGITNGYAWYTTSGCRQDYMNYFHDCREYTLELHSVKMTPENQLNNFWNYNYRSLLNYIKQVRYGISGKVTNSITGDPVRAKVTIEDHDNNNSFVYSNLPVGNYNRPIKQGTYDLKFTSFGYYDLIVNDISVDDYQSYILDVEMIPLIEFAANFNSSLTLAATEMPVDYYDLSIGGNIIEWHWVFEGGNPAESYDENPVGVTYSEPGTYPVKLTVSTLGGSSQTKQVDDYITIKEAVVMVDTVVTTCDLLFYDSGGEFDDYSDRERYTTVFMPGYVNDKIKVDFIEFDVEYKENCENDYLEIYDGIDISAPLIGKWCGTDSPGIITADNEYGALTFYFRSNFITEKFGWKAWVYCDSGVGIINESESDIKVYPIPANEVLRIAANNSIQRVLISDLKGNIVKEQTINANEVHINVSELNSGFYLLKVAFPEKVITRKLVIK